MKIDVKYWEWWRKGMRKRDREELEQDFEPTLLWEGSRKAQKPQAMHWHLRGAGVPDRAYKRQQERHRMARGKPLDFDPEDARDEIAEIDTTEAVGALLLLLPVRAREVITLLYLYGWTHLEVAAYTGASENAIWHLEQRAVRRLRGLLQKISGMFGPHLPRRDPLYRREPSRWRRTYKSRGFLAR